VLPLSLLTAQKPHTGGHPRHALDRRQPRPHYNHLHNQFSCCLTHVPLAAFHVYVQVAIRTTHWTVINHALIWGTLALWLPFLAVLQGLCGSVPSLNPLCGLGPELLGSAGFWLGAVIGAPAAALLADYAIMVFQRQMSPRASQLLQVGVIKLCYTCQVVG
jgi:hypothetical protein